MHISQLLSAATTTTQINYLFWRIPPVKWRSFYRWPQTGFCFKQLYVIIFYIACLFSFVGLLNSHEECLPSYSFANVTCHASSVGCPWFIYMLKQCSLGQFKKCNAFGELCQISILKERNTVFITLMWDANVQLNMLLLKVETENHFQDLSAYYQLTINTEQPNKCKNCLMLYFPSNVLA